MPFWPVGRVVKAIHTAAVTSVLSRAIRMVTGHLYSPCELLYDILRAIIVGILNYKKNAKAKKRKVV